MEPWILLLGRAKWQFWAKLPHLTTRVHGVNRTRPPEDDPHERKSLADAVCQHSTWGVQVLFFFSGMEADRNVKVVGGDVAIL